MSATAPAKPRSMSALEILQKPVWSGNPMQRPSFVCANQTTPFGPEHGVADIRTPEEFRQRVAGLDVERLRDYVGRQRRTGAPAGTAACMAA